MNKVDKANLPGYKQSAKWRTKKAKQMAEYEREAKERGIPVCKVIAEKIQ